MTDEREGTTIDTTEDPKTKLDGLETLYALRGKNSGCSQQLLGKVVLISFLINDGESCWTPAAAESFQQMMKSLCDELMEESRLDKSQLQVAYATCQVNIPYVVDRKTNNDCIFDVLRQFGHKNPAEYQRHYESKFHRDETVISLVFNKAFRSYAITTSGGASDAADEISYISFNPNDIASSKRTYKHEMMHQFGAIDYYYPENLEFKAKKRFPDSVMHSGSAVDDLTRYVIGWDEAPSDEAVAFLEEIKMIPPEEIEHAMTKEWL